MSTSELDSRNIAISMRKSVENLVISSQDAIGQSISQALTFSGVISQHANQIIQENKNISRSPSPSLRGSEVNDLLDNDKDFFPGNLIESGSFQNETIHVPSHPAGDAISVSSASDVTAVSSSVRADGTKQAPSPNPSRAGEVAGSVRTKKKSWYNSLYPTYKNKSDDFKRYFKDLPDDERLIVDYSCALQKDILAHGRLYASQNYLCFYASIFGWETSMSLRWKDVTAITKEKTALVIPNAILVCTEGEKHFLTSFSGRDKAYLMLFRVWQNALMDQPMTSQEIWQWVHSCYGEELGFNSDDEGYGRDLPVDVPLISDAVSEEVVEAALMEGGDEREREDRVQRSHSHRDHDPPLVTNGGSYGTAGEGEGDTLPTDMSDTSDSEDKHNDLEKCSSSHGGKLLLHQQFPFNIDQLFTMIFTNSKFNLELLAARGTTDYVQAPWQPAAGLKCRQVSYVLGLTSGPIGPKEVHVTETQVMNKCSKPGVLYSIDATSENTGIPYADYFTVEAHYCMQRVSEHLTDFLFYGHVKYKKSMWPMVKAFLEKNAMSGLEEYARLLATRLAGEAGAQPVRKQRRARRHHNYTAHVASQEPVAAAVPPVALLGGAGRAGRGGGGGGGGWLAAVLLLLLALNAALYWRLYRPPHHRDLHDRMKGVNSPPLSEWSALLEKHTRRQRGELLAWRDALDTTVTHLHQTEQALRKLLETIEPSLAQAQEEATDKDKDGDRDVTPEGGGEPTPPPPAKVEL